MMTSHTVKIVKDESALRTAALKIPVSDICTEKTRGIISAMSSALAKEEDGVAIAAPQIGEPIRLFVVSGKVLARLAPKNKKGKQVDIFPDAVFINPILIKSSKKKQTVEEGCLSLRYWYGKVRRSARVTIEAHNEKGEKITKNASGLLAQIFQHEVDHLNGVLFTDKAIDLIDMPPQSK